MRLGKTIPILELMLLIAGLQWVIGPIVEYNFPSLHWKYYMYVEQVTYMEFVVPAFLCFSLVILSLTRKFSKINIPLNNLNKYSDYGIQIVIIGFVFDFLGGFLPGTLGFVAFLFSNFKFVGAIVLYYSDNPKLKKIFYLIILFLLVTSISRGLFHDFILWSIFFYIFWALKNKPSVPLILTTFVAAVLFALTLQTVKSAFREQVWNNYSGNKLELFVNLMLDSIFADEVESEQFDDGVSTNVRLNQGWIISAVLNNIPVSQDYLNGVTVKNAVYASLLPRFLNPNKTEAGGKENFRKFTGLELNSGASMGISILGEAYGNFAQTGGIVFMGLWGFFLVRVWGFLLKKMSENLLLVAFIPLIFLQVVKAETELVVVLNHLVKSTIIVFLFLWFAKKFWNWELENGNE